MAYMNLLSESQKSFKDREGREPSWHELGCELLKKIKELQEKGVDS